MKFLGLLVLMLAISACECDGQFYGLNRNYGELQTVTFTTTGSNIWQCPTGVTSVTVELIGGGGGGGYSAYNCGGGGGGGGAFARATVSVVPGNSYPAYVGAGGLGNSSGVNTDGVMSYFKTAADSKADGGKKGGISATGGSSLTSSGGVGGLASNSVGTLKYSGGSGGEGSWTETPIKSCNGKGGSPANISGEGSDGYTNYQCFTTINQGASGSPGVIYGEGGSGAYDTDNANLWHGGNGKGGRVIIYYYN